MKPVYVIGTCDTKEAELRYAVAQVIAAGAPALLVDISTTPSTAQADVTPEMVAKHHPQGADAVLGHADRGKAVTAMAEALGRFLLSRDDIGAVLGLGGGGNTSMVTEAMRALPIGVPKLMVSTMASGNVAPYVGPTDIMMMHAVADVAGLNAITRTGDRQCRACRGRHGAERHSRHAARPSAPWASPCSASPRPASRRSAT